MSYQNSIFFFLSLFQEAVGRTGANKHHRHMVDPAPVQCPCPKCCLSTNPVAVRDRSPSAWWWRTVGLTRLVAAAPRCPHPGPLSGDRRPHRRPPARHANNLKSKASGETNRKSVDPAHCHCTSRRNNISPLYETVSESAVVLWCSHPGR